MVTATTIYGPPGSRDWFAENGRAAASVFAAGGVSSWSTVWSTDMGHTGDHTSSPGTNWAATRQAGPGVLRHTATAATVATATINPGSVKLAAGNKYTFMSTRFRITTGPVANSMYINGIYPDSGGIRRGVGINGAGTYFVGGQAASTWDATKKANSTVAVDANWHDMTWYQDRSGTKIWFRIDSEAWVPVTGMDDASARSFEVSLAGIPAGAMSDVIEWDKCIVIAENT